MSHLIEPETHTFIKLGALLNECSISYELMGDHYIINETIYIYTHDEAQVFIDSFYLGSEAI